MSPSLSQSRHQFSPIPREILHIILTAPACITFFPQTFFYLRHLHVKTSIQIEGTILPKCSDKATSHPLRLQYPHKVGRSFSCSSVCMRERHSFGMHGHSDTRFRPCDQHYFGSPKSGGGTRDLLPRKAESRSSGGRALKLLVSTTTRWLLVFSATTTQLHQLLFRHSPQPISPRYHVSLHPATTRPDVLSMSLLLTPL